MHDELAEALPTCTTCLRQLEPIGDPPDLYWVCDCGITSP